MSWCSTITVYKDVEDDSDEDARGTDLAPRPPNGKRLAIIRQNFFCEFMPDSDSIFHFGIISIYHFSQAVRIFCLRYLKRRRERKYKR